MKTKTQKPSLQFVGEVCVPVDSGTIEFAFDGNLEAHSDAYGTGQTMSNWTAKIVTDGMGGGIKTPGGDGGHDVKFHVLTGTWPESCGIHPKGWNVGKGFRVAEQDSKPRTLSVGDCGNVCGSFEIPAGAIIWGAWNRAGNVLHLMAYVETKKELP